MVLNPSAEASTGSKEESLSSLKNIDTRDMFIRRIILSQTKLRGSSIEKSSVVSNGVNSARPYSTHPGSRSTLRAAQVSRRTPIANMVVKTIPSAASFLRIVL